MNKIVTAVVLMVLLSSIAMAKPVDPLASVWAEIDIINQKIKDIQNKTIDLQTQIYNIQLLPGPRGEQGVPGAQGAQGEQGLSGITGYEVIQVTMPIILPEGSQDNLIPFTANCPAGKKIISGGYNHGPLSSEIATMGSFPNTSVPGWDVVLRDPYIHAGDVEITIYAICANIQ